MLAPEQAQVYAISLSIPRSIEDEEHAETRIRGSLAWTQRIRWHRRIVWSGFIHGHSQSQGFELMLTRAAPRLKFRGHILQPCCEAVLALANHEGAQRSICKLIRPHDGAPRTLMRTWRRC